MGARMKLSAWIEKKLESPEFRNQYISDLKEEIKRMESKLKVAVDAIAEYQRECGNPAPDYVMRRLRRKELFDALKTIQGKGDGG